VCNGVVDLGRWGDSIRSQPPLLPLSSFLIVYARMYTYIRPPPPSHRGGLRNSVVGRPNFWQGVHYVVTNALLARLILVYSLTSFLNGGLFLSITLLAQDRQGYDMSPKDVRACVGGWSV
jgi:hypothetical protein